MGKAVFPPCCLAWGQTMVGVMVVIMTSFKMTYAHTLSFSASDPPAGNCWPMPPLETPGHTQTSLAQSLVGTLLFSQTQCSPTNVLRAFTSSSRQLTWCHLHLTHMSQQCPHAFALYFMLSLQCCREKQSPESLLINWFCKLKNKFRLILSNNIHEIVTESNLTLLTTWQPNESERRGVEAKNMTLFGKPADRGDGRLMSQSNHLVEIWKPG